MKPTIRKRIRKLVRRTKSWVWRATLPIRSRIEFTFFSKLYFLEYNKPYTLLDGTATAFDGSGCIKRRKPHCIEKIIEQKDVILQKVVDDLRSHFNTEEPIEYVGFVCENLGVATCANTKTFRLQRSIFYTEDGTIKDVKDKYIDKAKEHEEYINSGDHEEFYEMLRNLPDYDD